MRLRSMITAAGVVVASGLIGLANPAATMAAQKGQHASSHSGRSSSAITRLFDYQPATCQLTAGGWLICCHFKPWTPQNLGLIEVCTIQHAAAGVYVQPS